jgi:peptidoglycan/xylan/chitin deacetylase (PgdA/CDA1 family)/folate-dependent phosphoribosylglycinamide formyltransferase PurN
MIEPSRATLPPEQRRVVILAEKAWAGLYLTSMLPQLGVQLTALVVERERTDEIALNLTRWKELWRQEGLRRSLWAFLGMPLGPAYVVRHLCNRQDYPTLGDVKRLKVPVEQVDGFKTAQCHDVLRRLRPDVAVICGTPILPESLLAIPKLCTINIHTSILPHYRGGGSLFWPLFFRDTEKVGFTIHKAVAAVDAGPYLCQERVAVQPHDTPQTLLRKCFRAAVPRLARLLREDPLNEQSWHDYEKPLPYAFRKPHRRIHQYFLGTSLLRKMVMPVKKLLYFGSRLNPVPARHRTGRFVALFCHRALDDAIPRTDWRRVLGHPTISEIRQKLCDMKRYYCFVSLSKWLELLESHEPVYDNYAVFTVDDGYRDFRTGMLPLLEELGIPAALFVCTGAVETGLAWYQQVYNLIEQVQRDRLRIPWMDTEIYFGDVEQRVLTVEYVLLAYLKCLSRSRRQNALDDLLQANNIESVINPADAFCSVEDLRQLKASSLIELYPHSHEHHPLETLSDEEVRKDLQICNDFFRQHLGLTTSILSYPNGSFRDSQRPLLKVLGFQYGVTRGNGFELQGKADKLRLTRNAFGSESLADFYHRCRSLGILP